MSRSTLHTIVDWLRFPLIRRIQRDIPYGKVLDVGCGKGSRAFWARIREAWGIEADEKYFQQALNGGRYRILFHGDARTVMESILSVGGERFDAVLLLDVIEHLPKAEGRAVLHLAQCLGDIVIVTTPDGFQAQNPRDAAESPYQRHRSGWTSEDFKGWDITRWSPNGEPAIYARWAVC